MDSRLWKKIVHLDAATVQRKMREERDEILEAIRQGRIKPDKALLDLLVELNVAAGDVSAEPEPEVEDDEDEAQS